MAVRRRTRRRAPLVKRWCGCSPTSTGLANVERVSLPPRRGCARAARRYEPDSEEPRRSMRSSYIRVVLIWLVVLAALYVLQTSFS
jgi:hypothetical protein